MDRDLMQLGPFRLEARLGAGAMGTVYRGRHVDTEQVVAVKVLRATEAQSDEARARFQREVRAGQDIDHPNVVRILDAGEGDLKGARVQYLVMDFVEGESLASVIEREGALPEGIYRHVLRELTQGLAALHAAGFVHRDVKPQNVLITPRDEVVLADLGIARRHIEGTHLTQEGQFVGSVAYAAPESFESDEVADPRYDVWSLGVLLYQMATGVHPFLRATPEATLRAVLEVRPPRFSHHGVGSAPFMEALVHRLLVRSHSDRPADGQAVLALLDGEADANWWRAETGDSEARQPWVSRLDLRLPLAARLEERAALADFVDAPGIRPVQVVLSESGGGKTRLVHEALQDATRTRVHYVPCDAAEAHAWLHTLLLATYGAQDEIDAALTEIVGSQELAGRAREALDPRHERSPKNLGSGLVVGIALAVVEAYRQQQTDQALVLWFEDLDQAPLGMRMQVVELARAIAPTGAGLLITARATGLPEEIRQMGEWAHAQTTELPPLDRDAIWTCLRQYLGADHLADDLADFVHERSGGMPSLLLGSLERLQNEGYIRHHPDGMWSLARSRADLAALRLPTSASGLWRGRIKSLDASDRELLDVAACAGSPFAADLLATVLGRPLLDVLRRLTRLERGPRLVRGVGDRFEFPTPAVREAIRDGAPEALLKAYHRALAIELARQLPADAQGEAHWRVCEQWLLAEDHQAATAHLLPAALHLSVIGAQEQANEAIDTVLSSSADLPLDAIGRLVFERAITTVESGETLSDEVISKWIDRARAEGHHGCQAYCLLTWAHRRGTKGEFIEAYEMLEEALDHARRGEVPEAVLHVMLTMGQLGVYLGHHEASIEQVGEALEITEQHPALRGQRPILLITQSANWSSLGRFDRSLPLVEQALVEARELGHTRAEVEALRIAGAIYDRLGRWDDAVEVTEQAIDLARISRDRTNAITNHANLSDFLSALGRIQEAWKHARISRDLFRDMPVLRARAFATHALVQRACLLGRQDEAIENQEDLAEEIAKTADKALFAQWQLGWAQIEANREHWSAAEGHLTQALDRIGDDGPLTWRCRLHFLRGRALHFAGDAEAARAAVATAFDLGRTMDTEISWGLLAGAWLAHLDPEQAPAVDAHAATKPGPVEVPVQIELAWLAGHADPAAAAHARALVAQLLRPLSEEGQTLSRTGHWLHRRICGDDHATS